MKSAEEIHKTTFDLLKEIQQFSENPEYQGLNTAITTAVTCMNKIRISEVAKESGKNGTKNS